MNASAAPGGLAKASLVSLWRHATDLSIDHFECSGVFVGNGLVLTVKHVLEAGGALWVRPLADATQAYPVRGTPIAHPELDAALLRIETMPAGARAAVCDPHATFDQVARRLTLNGFFEGRSEAAHAIQLLAFDPIERYHLIEGKQPKGHSGSGVAVDGRLWGLTIAHFTDANTHRGCVVTLGQLWPGWLEGYVPDGPATEPSIAMAGHRQRPSLGKAVAGPPSPQALPAGHDLPLTALQSAAKRLLGEVNAHPQPTDRAFLAAWAKDAGSPLADVHALVEAVCSGDGSAATVMARVRDIVHDLGWTLPGAASRPSPQTAQFVIVVLLVAAEQYVRSRSPVQPEAAELARLMLALDKPLAAAIVGACLLNRGLLLRVDPSSGHAVAANVLSDMPAVEYGFLSARDAAEAELAAAMATHREGGTIEARRRVLKGYKAEGVPETHSLKVDLKRFHDRHGAQMMFGVPGSSGPAALLDAELRRALSTELGVDTFFFDARDATGPGADDTQWKRFAASIMGYIDPVVDAMLACRADGSSTRLVANDGDSEMARTRVFISYSHSERDAVWRERVLEHLGVLKQQGLIDLWDDTQIGAGDDWYDKIHTAMLSSRVAVLLVSPAFLNSGFILKEEVPKLFDQHKSDGMRIVPVLIRDAPWQQVPWLAAIQMRPGSTPVASMEDRHIDPALAKIANEIATMCRGA